MRIYVACRGNECVASTSLPDVAHEVRSTDNSLRSLFSQRGDSIQVKGWSVYRTELGRIKGRGRK